LQVHDLVSKLPGYQRTTRYELLYARTNAQSRKLKGLPPTTDEPEPEPPTALAIHEFAGDVNQSAKDLVRNSAESKKIISEAKQTEFIVFGLKKGFGKSKFFD
jgi:hypothetical protein